LLQIDIYDIDILPLYIKVFEADTINAYGSDIVSSELNELFRNTPNTSWNILGIDRRIPNTMEVSRFNTLVDTSFTDLICRKFVNMRGIGSRPVFYLFNVLTEHNALKIIPQLITDEHRALSLFRLSIFNNSDHKHSSSIIKQAEYNSSPKQGEPVITKSYMCKDNDLSIPIKVSLYVTNGKFVIDLTKAPMCRRPFRADLTTSKLMMYLFDSINRMYWKKTHVALKIFDRKIEMTVRDSDTNTIQSIVFQLSGEHAIETIVSFKTTSLFPLSFHFEEARLSQSSFDHRTTEQEIEYFEKATNTEIIIDGLVDGSEEKNRAIVMLGRTETSRSKKWHMPPVLAQQITAPAPFEN
jgi:hypothetical protein